MFSLENFYYILYTNLLRTANFADCYFFPFGSTNVDDLMFGIHEPINSYKDHCFFYDQEPLNINTVQHCVEKFLPLSPIKNKSIIFATSEHSSLVDEACHANGFKKWYYFFHGFAALDWYRDYQYIPIVENHFTKVFISFNRLVTKDRSYRLNFVSQLKERDLLKYGSVSLILKDNGLGTWQEELADPDTRLSASAKELVSRTLTEIGTGLTIDVDNPPGHASANAGSAELNMYRSALWHVVTETVFYDNKQHLTEKIFKPIVARRPFMLIGAVGNLAYLRGYGFKTFGRWIDESYDNEADPDKRIEIIVLELEKLCQLSMAELEQMHQEMQEILDFNFNHLYGEFKNIIVDELVDNFKQVSGTQLDLANVKQLLKK